MTPAPLIEAHSGIPFPASLTPPGGSAPQWIAGAGIQQFSLFRINVYAFGLYVDRDAARAALAEILFCYRPAERLAVVVAGTGHEPIQSRTLCEVLFDLYLGTEPLSPQGRRSVIAGFPALLAGAQGSSTARARTLPLVFGLPCTDGWRLIARAYSVPGGSTASPEPAGQRVRFAVGAPVSAGLPREVWEEQTPFDNARPGVYDPDRLRSTTNRWQVPRLDGLREWSSGRTVHSPRGWNGGKGSCH